MAPQYPQWRKDRLVRLFVSSDFRDMWEEREILAKLVFPELRVRCTGREVDFVPVDLNLSAHIVKAHSVQSLRTSLTEIDHCRPWFLSLLGERYGWIPPEVDWELLEERPWLAEKIGVSITELEILHAALNEPLPKGTCFFYLRDPTFLEQVSEPTRRELQEEDPDAQGKLRALKQRIRRSAHFLRDNYPDPTTFGRVVLKDLWAAIDEAFPVLEEPDEPTARDLHRNIEGLFERGGAARPTPPRTQSAAAGPPYDPALDEDLIVPVLDDLEIEETITDEEGDNLGDTGSARAAKAARRKELNDTLLLDETIEEEVVEDADDDITEEEVVDDTEDDLTPDAPHRRPSDRSVEIDAGRLGLERDATQDLGSEESDVEVVRLNVEDMGLDDEDLMALDDEEERPQDAEPMVELVGDSGGEHFEPSEVRVVWKRPTADEPVREPTEPQAVEQKAEPTVDLGVEEDFDMEPPEADTVPEARSEEPPAPSPTQIFWTLGSQVDRDVDLRFDVILGQSPSSIKTVPITTSEGAPAARSMVPASEQRTDRASEVSGPEARARVSMETPAAKRAVSDAAKSVSAESSPTLSEEVDRDVDMRFDKLLGESAESRRPFEGADAQQDMEPDVTTQELFGEELPTEEFPTEAVPSEDTSELHWADEQMSVDGRSMGRDAAAGPKQDTVHLETMDADELLMEAVGEDEDMLELTEDVSLEEIAAAGAARAVTGAKPGVSSPVFQALSVAELAGKTRQAGLSDPLTDASTHTDVPLCARYGGRTMTVFAQGRSFPATEEGSVTIKGTGPRRYLEFFEGRRRIGAVPLPIAEELGEAVSAISVKATHLGSDLEVTLWSPESSWKRTYRAPLTQRDRVHCTVFAPRETRSGSGFLVQAFLHLPSQAQQAQSEAQVVDETAEARGSRSLSTSIERGSTLGLHLRVGGLDVDQPVKEITWQGEPLSAQFRVTVPEEFAPRRVAALLTLSRDGVPIGKVEFSVEVVSAAREVDSEPQPTGMARRFSVYFISYARHDLREVLKRVQMLPLLGIGFRQDLFHLTPGVRWKEKIHQFIDESDAVLLFWSSHARDSEWVMDECRHAIDTKGKDAIIPVLIEGPPPVAPPPELQELHFDDPILYFS
ncbi:MAG: TIR domain-containing protein [Thermodesulfobacteriota bacterium]